MKNVIGIDVGGTKISGIVFNGKEVVEELTIVTPKNIFEFERNILKLADFLSAKQKIFGLGIGMAGQVDTKRGIVNYSPNIRYVKELNLPAIFARHGYERVKVDNDANCFTRAELLVGQGKGFKNFVAVTLGTGIGGGIVIDHKIYRGENNSGGELGHIVLGDEFFESIFKNFRDKKDFKGAGHVVGQALASFINIFAPEAIIIGGGYGHNESTKYLPAAKLAIKKYIFNRNATTEVLITKLKNAGAIGAALLLK